MKVKEKLQELGMKRISFVIVNLKKAAKSKHLLDRIVDFKVYQDKTGNIWKMLNGSKDDFYIYNRCGNLSGFVPSKKSFLGKNYVSKAIFKAYNGEHGCGKCEADSKYKKAVHPTPEPKEKPCLNTAKYDQYCRGWAGRGLCNKKNKEDKKNKYHGFMKDHCSKTCKFCKAAGN